MSVKTAGINALDGELVARGSRPKPVTTGRMGQTGHIPVALVDLSGTRVASRDCDGLSLLATLGADHEELALGLAGKLCMGAGSCTALLKGSTTVPSIPHASNSQVYEVAAILARYQWGIACTCMTQSHHSKGLWHTYTHVT